MRQSIYFVERKLINKKCFFIIKGIKLFYFLIFEEIGTFSFKFKTSSIIKKNWLTSLRWPIKVSTQGIPNKFFNFDCL